ncbi:MAG: CPBP family intramembrane metalloprotease [Clostridiaceae bacterium]|nr:CPBP family intramembrane metalloprotease [Clostridiaceae bacterium]
MNLGNLSLFTLGIIAYYIFVYRMKGGLVGIFPLGFEAINWLWLVAGYGSMVCVFLILLKIKSPEYFYDEAVDLLITTLSPFQLIITFILGGVAEELIFRGIIQLWFGLIPSSVLFTLIHVRYLKKPYMALETLCLGLILGTLYILTKSIWICTVAHILMNMTTAWIIKSKKINYTPVI